MHGSFVNYFLFIALSICLQVYSPSLAAAQELQVVEFPLEARLTDTSRSSNARLVRRDGVELGVYEPAYNWLVNISVGTPSRILNVVLDTGSSDVLVPSSVCSNASTSCPGRYGTLSPNQSTSYQPLGNGGKNTFSFGQNFSAVAALDTFIIGNATLKNQSFFIADGLTQGLLGVSYPENEANTKIFGVLPTVVDSMKASGAIKSRSLSVYFNNQDAPGSVIFGGLDYAKYEGSFTVLPIRSTGIYTNTKRSLFSVDVTSIVLHNTTAVPTDPILSRNLSMVLDTGAVGTSLPLDVYKQWIAYFNSSQTTLDPYPRINCSELQSNRTLTIQIGGEKGAFIQAPISTFIRGPISSGGADYCYMAIIPTELRLLTMGADFFKSAYVAFDMENDQVGIAQSKVNATESSILEITPETGLRVASEYYDPSGQTNQTAS